MAGGLLLLMAGLGLGSMLGNSATSDEVAHIPAGYATVYLHDYRLNPEHPPLMKDLAALPLQFMHLAFPTDLPTWTMQGNGQWDVGRYFLYYLGNNADMILFAARMPILLVALLFGVFLYEVCRRHWGTGVGLLTLFFYCLSPNILAHATLVTTDLGLSAFAFVAIVAFARFVRMPTRWNLVWLSLALAGVELVKFSAFILYPLLGLIAAGLVWAMDRPKRMLERLRVLVGGFVAASALSWVWMWLFYMPQVWLMPEDVQNRLIQSQLPYGLGHSVAQVLISFNHGPVLKPIAQYLLGLAMVFGRVVGGGVTYFNGQASTQIYRLYFPELVLLKTQVALLIMLAVVMGYGIWRVVTGDQRRLGRFASHVRTHVLEWTLGIFGIVYFSIAVAGNLELGIRHILPVYIPLFVLVAIGVVKTLRLLAKQGQLLPASIGFVVLAVWYGASTILVYPSYLAYFNEIAGGPAHADRYFSDSSVDWGQDLKRLKSYVVDHPEIKHIAVDYFGGGDVAYYFCGRRYDEAGHLVATPDGYDCSHSVYEPWHAGNGEYTGQYIAVSEAYLESDRYFSVAEHNPGYGYLRARQPIAKIGGSIYVYKLF